MDVQSLNARLSRLEEKLASGQLTLAAAPQQQEQALSWDDDAPPPPDDSDIPPENPNELRSASPAARAGFWPELVERLRTSLKPPAMGMFSTAENAPLQGILTGDRLLLVASDDFTLGIVDKPNVLQAVSEKAAALLGRPVAVQVQKGGATPQQSGEFDKLLRFGAEHPDIVDIK